MSIDILQEKIRAKRNPTVAGLDPRLDHLPPDLLARHIAAGGETLEAAAAAVWEFNRALLDALHPVVPAVKLQAACYEALGVPGMALLRDTAVYAAALGLYVILDAKRGDIGSTAAAYADAFLGATQVGQTALRPFPADALTVNPYLGSDGRPLYRLVAERCAGWGADGIGASGYADVGVVVGATYPAQLAELRAALPHTFFLIPGYGAQGGRAADVALGFDERGGGAVVNSSRAITCAWQKQPGAPFAQAACDEACRMRAALQGAIPNL